MDQGKFENRIKDKFEGQTLKAPQGVWDNIENSLNADLVSSYESKHLVYKWVSIAAVFVVVVLFGILYLPFNQETEIAETGATYNALLSSDINYDEYYYQRFTGSAEGLTFDSYSQYQKPTVLVENSDDSESLLVLPDRTFTLNSIETELVLADVNPEIYRYRSSYSIPRRIREDKRENKVWAGVEAGAGNFNSDFGGSGTLANSLNPAGLASAVGSGSFVNPTTNISEDMNEAIATTIGVDFGVQMGKRWTLESGVAYTAVENSGTASINVLDVYTIDNSELIDKTSGIGDPPGALTSSSARETSVEVSENYDYEVELNNRVQFASIPLKAGYFVFDDKFSLRLNAGVSANYLMEGNISDPSKEILNSEELNLYNEWSFDGIGGVEFGYSIFNKFDLTIEPNYRHSITPISNSTNNPSRFLVQTGLRYTLK